MEVNLTIISFCNISCFVVFVVHCGTKACPGAATERQNTQNADVESKKKQAKRRSPKKANAGSFFLPVQRYASMIILVESLTKRMLIVVV